MKNIILGNYPSKMMERNKDKQELGYPSPLNFPYKKS